MILERLRRKETRSSDKIGRCLRHMNRFYPVTRNNRVGSRRLFHRLASHTTVRTDPYTAVRSVNKLNDMPGETYQAETMKVVVG